VPAAGVPVEGSIQFSLSNGSSFGAVLVTESPVKKETYYGPETPWGEWVSANTEALMKSYKREIKDYGLWIVTKIYSTKMAYISVLQNSKRNVELGFKAEVGGIGKINPHGGWQADRSSSGWFKYPSKVRETLFSNRTS